MKTTRSSCLGPRISGVGAERTYTCVAGLRRGKASRRITNGAKRCPSLNQTPIDHAVEHYARRGHLLGHETTLSTDS